MKQWIILGTLLMPIAVMAETTLRFEPREVALGESTRLILETTQAIKSAPDFSSLKGSFAIGNQEQSTSSVVINGRKSGENRIVVTVFPRKEGVLSSGEILLNGRKLEPASVTVLPASAVNGLPITFKANASTQKPYVQGMVLYTVKLSDGAGLMGARMMSPEVEGARVIPLNMDKAYQEYQDGNPVQVVERTFGIIPEKSGRLSIPPIELYGALPNMSAAVTPGDLFAQGMLFNGLNDFQKEVRLETNAVELDVQGKPAGWVGWWLPSGDVKIHVDDQFPSVINVGDSLTRTIQLVATGVEGSQLPTIDIPAVAGVKVYPSPEQRDTIQTESGDILGTIKTSVVLVPTKNGEMTLPDISVPWFNVVSGRTEFARLPSKKIKVVGESMAPAPVVEKPEPKAENKPAPVVETQKAVADKKETPKKDIPMSWVVGFCSGGVLLGLGLGCVIFRHRKHHKSYRLADYEKKAKKKKKILPDLYPM